MTEAIIAIVLGLIGLALGGELLVRGAVGIARKLGISNLVTGLVIVGAATSMPEMVASVEAALRGSPEIAWGNITGSNIANSLLILGAAALITPIVLTGLGKRDAVVGVVAALLLWGLAFSQVGNVVIGIVLLALLGAYIYWRYNHPRPMDEEEEATPPPHILVALALTAAGVGALVLGGQSLVGGAITIAELAGLSETVIGLTIVAVGTSLPELAASAAAAFRGKPGLAVGNVLGSNIYNIFLIGGATMVIAPFAVPQDLVEFELPVMIAAALGIWVLLAKAHAIGRAVGFAMLAIFAGFNAYLLLPGS